MLGRRLIVLLVVALMGVGASKAQVSGTVSTPDGGAAAYASVLLFKDSATNVSPRAFAITDVKGRFVIDVEPQPTDWIVVRFLGCKEHRQRLRQTELHIRLEAQVQGLDEVVVKSTYVPVRVHGDTVEFNTDYYRTGTEETAAEVIAHLPGVEVSESGEVSFAGKAVDKVLVDGKDLFASGSDGALNTLPADAVRGAELLTNYRSGSLIDQFSGRQLTALNIKTDGKHRLAGRVGVAAGLIERGRVDASLLYMGSDFSLTTVLGANNNGEALFSLEDYIKTMVGLDNILSTNGKGFNPSEEELNMLMPPSNIYSSEAALAALSGSWSPSAKFRLKGNLMLNGTDLHAKSLVQQQYLAFDATQTSLEAEQSRSFFLTGHVQERWSPNDKLEISNLTQLSRTSLFANDTADEAGLTNSFATDKDNLLKTQLKEEFALNLQHSERALLSAHVDLHHSRRNYSCTLLSDNALLPSMPYVRNADGDYTLDTRRRITDFNLAPDITYAYNLTHRLTLAATAAASYHREAFHYGTTVGEQIEWRTATATLRLSKPRGLLRFSLGADFRHTAWQSSIGGLADSACFDVLPTGSIELAFSETHRLALEGSLKRDAIELEYLLRDTLVSGYSSMLAGSDITNPFAHTANLQLNYYYFDLYTNTLFFAIMGMSDSRFAVQPHSVQDSSIASMARYDNDGSMRMQFANLSLRQGLGSWPWDLGLGFNATHSLTTTTVNAIRSDMEAFNCGGRLALTSRRKGVMNMELGGSTNVQRSEASGMDNSLWEVGGHAALLLAWEKLTMRLQVAYTHAEGGDEERNLVDVGGRAEYRLGRWRITLRGGNLLHLRSQEWISSASTPLFLSTTTYRRLPGYLLLGAAYRF